MHSNSGQTILKPALKNDRGSAKRFYCCDKLSQHDSELWFLLSSHFSTVEQWNPFFQALLKRRIKSIFSYKSFFFSLHDESIHFSFIAWKMLCKASLPYEFLQGAFVNWKKVTRLLTLLSDFIFKRRQFVCFSFPPFSA